MSEDEVVVSQIQGVPSKDDFTIFLKDLLLQESNKMVGTCFHFIFIEDLGGVQTYDVGECCFCVMDILNEGILGLFIWKATGPKSIRY